MSDVLKLENFHLNRLELFLPADLVGKKAQDANLKLDFNTSRHKDHACIYRLIFRIAWTPVYVDGKPQSPQVKAEIVGYFSFPDGMPEDKREWLIRYNGILLLYGLLRGQIATISGAFPTEKFILPSFNVKEAIVEIEKRKSRATTKSQESKQQSNFPKSKGKQDASKRANGKKLKTQAN